MTRVKAHRNCYGPSCFEVWNEVEINSGLGSDGSSLDLFQQQSHVTLVYAFDKRTYILLCEYVYHQ